MDTSELNAKLHPLERKVLPHIKGSIAFEALVSAAGISEIETMRAIQWLENKSIISVDTKELELIFLDKNGKKYKEIGLPEKRFLQAIQKTALALGDFEKKGLEKQEVSVCIGALRKTGAIIVNKEGSKTVISITEQGKKFIEREWLEEKFLSKEFPIQLAGIAPEEKFAVDNLIKRKDILKIEKKKSRTIKLTSVGKEILTQDISSVNFSDSLTQNMLKSGRWKDQKFRAYDVKINVPKIYPGKKHFVRDAMEYIKKVWLEMGFVEMTGTMVQTSFWNFDALFTAQDHPVRELQDTFFIKNPEKGKLPDKKIVDKVKDAHENGKGTQSTGWGYSWDVEDAKKNVLRTHTTCLSARTISNLDKLPAKFFAVGKNFRNETVDWSHLFELAQVEGIVVDKNANLRHLIGYLKEFYKKLGFEKIRVRPGYFPYTEPSVEVDVFHPVHKKWMELGGAGIFRPEVVVPLFGEFVPVLAWGQGLERGIMDYFDIHDIRELYKNDLKQLREMKSWMR